VVTTSGAGRNLVVIKPDAALRHPNQIPRPQRAAVPALFRALREKLFKRWKRWQFGGVVASIFMAV